MIKFTEEELENEIWTKINTYSEAGEYYFSTLGRIKRCYSRYINKHSRIREDVVKYLKCPPCKTNGYCLFSTRTEDFKILAVRIHRMIAEEFIPNPENKPEVNHKNGIKHDNRLSNLEWSTHAENTQHAYDTGLNYIRNGEQHGRSILTEQKVLAIRRLYKINPKFSRTKTAKKLGVIPATISHIIHRRIWPHI